MLAAAAGIPDARVDELLELTGIPAFARSRAGTYSMGMRQRLGAGRAPCSATPGCCCSTSRPTGWTPRASAGCGPSCATSADEGKTILVSSHLLQEVEQTADEVVIIANGRLVRQGTIAELGGGGGAVVRTSDPAALAAALQQAGDRGAARTTDGAAARRHPDLRLVGDVALAAGLPVWELREQDRRPRGAVLRAHRGYQPQPGGPAADAGPADRGGAT